MEVLGMKAEKVWRQDYHTIVKVCTTQVDYVCVNQPHHTVISISVAVLYTEIACKLKIKKIKI